MSTFFPNSHQVCLWFRPSRLGISLWHCRVFELCQTEIYVFKWSINTLECKLWEEINLNVAMLTLFSGAADAIFSRILSQRWLFWCTAIASFLLLEFASRNGFYNDAMQWCYKHFITTNLHPEKHFVALSNYLITN